MTCIFCIIFMYFGMMGIILGETEENVSEEQNMSTDKV